MGLNGGKASIGLTVHLNTPRFNDRRPDLVGVRVEAKKRVISALRELPFVASAARPDVANPAHEASLLDPNSRG